MTLIELGIAIIIHSQLCYFFVNLLPFYLNLLPFDVPFFALRMSDAFYDGLNYRSKSFIKLNLLSVYHIDNIVFSVLLSVKL